MKEFSSCMAPVVHVEDLTIAYDHTPVLWDNDVAIPSQAIAAIIGPNGAGKSTLLKGILGLQPSLSGSVTILGRPFEDVRKQVAYIPQKSSVRWDFPTTVFDVVLMGRYVHLGWIRRPGKEDRRIAMEAIERMGLMDFKDRQISQLSGGQKQRAFIARAIAQEAKIYFMDEPLAGVDKKTEKAIFDFLKEAQSQGCTSVIVHHDLHTVRDYFNFAILLNKTVVAQGPVEEVFTEKNIEATYGSTMGVRGFAVDAQDAHVAQGEEGGARHG